MQVLRASRPPRARQTFVDAYGVRPEHVQIFILEVDDENWAKSGRLATDSG